MHDAPLRRKGRSVGTGRVLEGEDSGWRRGWVSGLHGVLTQRMRVHRTPYTRRAGAKSCVRGPGAPQTQLGGCSRRRSVDGSAWSTATNSYIPKSTYRMLKNWGPVRKIELRVEDQLTPPLASRVDLPSIRRGFLCSKIFVFLTGLGVHCWGSKLSTYREEAGSL